MRSFDQIWDRLADQGKCDARDGMEYARVRRYFSELKDRPTAESDIAALIIKQANLGPDDTD